MEEKSVRQENIMGTKPVNQLLVGMAVPIMLSMLVQALYNIVDSIFVSMVSEAALTAVSLVFPVQNLMIAVGVGTAVGINAVLSRRLGEKNYEAAEKVANNGIFITVLSYIAFAVFGIVGSRPLLAVMTTNTQVAEMGAQYMFICTVLSFGMFMQITVERILQVTGKTVYQMCSQLTGAIVNIILDPIMIFGLLGCPKMGVAGAALATVIGQFCGMFVGLAINHVKNHEVRLNLRGFKPEGRIIRSIYQVGLPSIIMQSISSVMTFGMNQILIGFTETAVAVFGVYFKLQSFVFMPVFGLTSALVPIVGYNYGAQQKTRILQTIKLACIMSVSIMAIGTLIFQLAPDLLMAMFQASDAMKQIGGYALRLISLSFILAGVDIVFSSMFQAMGDGVKSLMMSAVRQLVVLLPCAYLFSLTGELNAVWLSFLAAELVSFVLGIVFFRKIYRSTISRLPN